MRAGLNSLSRGTAAVVLLLGAAGVAAAQEAPQFTDMRRLTNKEALFQLSAAAGLNYRVEVSTNAASWNSLVTLLGTGSYRHTDSAALYLDSRFYRALQLNETNVLTGDHLGTANGDAVIHPLFHASFVMSWNGKVIYNDPDDDPAYQATYQGLPKADLILVSHSHGDHFSAAKIDAVRGPNAIIIAPQAVFNGLSSAQRALTIVLTNGASTNVLGLTVEAVPAYNSNHPVGTGNGYVLTVGGRRIYMSGDTGDIAEMRSLENIDVAFVCMNVPFTMSVNQAAGAVRAFRPKAIYPYHYRNQDSTFANLNSFKQQVGADLGIEVRLRSWY